MLSLRQQITTLMWQMAGAQAEATDAITTPAEREGRLSAFIRRAAEAQEGRGVLWWPAALAGGIGLYFALYAEPSLAVTVAAVLAAVLLVWFGRSVTPVLLVGLVLAGFALAKTRSDMVATPLLRATTAEVAITGRVVSVDPAARKRITLVIAPDAIEGLAPERTPVRLRLSAPEKNGSPPIGARVAFKAYLQPLPTPAEPGGFDYGRRLWFESVGGVGRVTTRLQIVEESRSPAARWEAWLSGVRNAMGERIRAVIEEPYASFAEALITGERSNIPREVNDSLLVSGLFHILSISGLHMWLVAGSVFWAVRAALAAVPALALGHPIKKWAAAMALLMGLFYLLLADSGVATQRSFIMVAVVFFAVIVDRPALSARNLAIAALIVLVLEPEAAVEASFQMSFLAVLGLVAFYETWSRWRASRDGGERPERHWAQRAALWLVAAAAASLATTLVAGFMSSLPAAYHFGRVSPYSLLANGLAIPVVAMLVMPAALLAAVLMLLGLEALPLLAMEQGLRLVIVISDYVAGLPGADVVMPQPRGFAVLLISAGALLLCLLLGKARWAGIALMVSGSALLLVPPERPDILIERTGQNVAVRNADGLLVPAHANRARATVERWLRTNGEEVKPPVAAKRDGWNCSGFRCEASVNGRRIAFLSRAEGQSFSCDGMDILIADFPLRRACPSVPVRIDRFDLWRGGAHAVHVTEQGIIISSARGEQGQRAWTIVPERRATPLVRSSRQGGASSD